MFERSTLALGNIRELPVRAHPSIPRYKTISFIVNAERTVSVGGSDERLRTETRRSVYRVRPELCQHHSAHELFFPPSISRMLTCSLFSQADTCACAHRSCASAKTFHVTCILCNTFPFLWCSEKTCSLCQVSFIMWCHLGRIAFCDVIMDCIKVKDISGLPFFSFFFCTTSVWLPERPN